MLVPIILAIQAQNTQALNALTGSLKDARQELGNLGRSAIAGGAALAGLAIGGSVRAAVDFESAMADVNKVLGESEVKAIKLDESLIKMTRSIPVSATGLAAIAASGGKLGIATKDIGEFTELVAKMGVAFEVAPEEAGTAFAKLQNVFSLTIPQLRNLGDAVNQLGDSASADAPQIVEAMARVGGVTRTFGLSAEETAGLTTAIISLGNAPEIAATSIASILPALQAATSGTTKFKSGLAMIGMSAQEMEQQIAAAPTKALESFIGKLGQLDSISRTKVLAKMFGQGADSRVLATLANDATQLNKAFTLAGNKAAYAGSMTKEFESRSNTTANAAQLFKNALFEVGLVIGQKLLPPINAAMAIAVPVLQLTADFLRTVPDGVIVIGAIGVAVTGAVAAFAVFNPAISLLALNFIRLSATSPLAAIVSLGGGMRAATASALGFSRAMVAGVGAGLASIPRLAMGAGSSLVGMAVAARSQLIGLAILARGQLVASLAAAIISVQTMSAASLWGGLVGGAGAAIGAVKGLIATIAGGGVALLANPLVLGVTAIALAATLIYKYWQPISGFFAGVMAGISQSIAPVKPQFDAITQAIAPLGAFVGGLAQSFLSLVAPVKDSDGAARSFGVTVGTFIGEAINIAVKGIGFLINQITRFVALVSQARAVAANLPGMNWIAPAPASATPTAIAPASPSIPSPVKSIASQALAVVNPMLRGMAQGHIPSHAGSLPLIQAAADEARAVPNARLVIANDREFILQDRGAVAVPAGSSRGGERSPTSAVNHSQSQIVNNQGRNSFQFNFSVSPGDDARAIAQQVIEIIEGQYQEERRAYLGA